MGVHLDLHHCSTRLVLWTKAQWTSGHKMNTCARALPDVPLSIKPRPNVRSSHQHSFYTFRQFAKNHGPHSFQDELLAASVPSGDVGDSVGQYGGHGGPGTRHLWLCPVWLSADVVPCSCVCVALLLIYMYLQRCQHYCVDKISLDGKSCHSVIFYEKISIFLVILFYICGIFAFETRLPM